MKKAFFFFLIGLALIAPNTMAAIPAPDFAVVYECSTTNFPLKSSTTCYFQNTGKMRVENVNASSSTDDRGFTLNEKQLQTYVIRADLNVLWSLNTYEKRYSEQLLPKNFQIFSLFRAKDGGKKTGEAILLGHRCDIVEYERPKTTSWIVKDIPGLELSLKTEYGDERNQSVIEAVQFVVANQNNSLFEIPRGSERVEVIANPSIVDDRFLVVHSNSAMMKVAIDLNTIKKMKDEKTDKSLIDLWVRFDVPLGNTAEIYINERKSKGLTTAGYERYAYYLEHWRLSNDRRIGYLGRIDCSVEGKELWCEATPVQWHPLNPEQADLANPIYDAIVAFALKNEELLSKNSEASKNASKP